MKYFLDTNIIIYFIKGSSPALLKHLKKVPEASIVLPSVVLAEIEYGARKSKDYGRTIRTYKAFTSFFQTVPFDKAASETYGKIRADLESKGYMIGANDCMIAAIVLANDGVLVTHNTKEFKRIKGLKIEDWTEE